MFSLGSLTPPFHSSAAPFADKFTEQEHFLTKNAPGDFQQPEPTDRAEGDQIGPEAVLPEHGSWLLLTVSFWDLLQTRWSCGPFSLYLLASLLCNAPSAQPTHQALRTAQKCCCFLNIHSLSSLGMPHPPGKSHSLVSLNR